MIELNTMEFDGKTYFEIETITHNNNTYIYYGNEEDTSLFKIFKLGNNDELIELSYDELNGAFTIFNEKHRN